jgi:ribonuclease HI
MIVVFCDGLCEPNPGGTACFGWVAYRGREKLAEDWGVVCSGPGATNNVAEYTAIVKALEWLLGNGHAGEEVEVRSDSQLCIRQLRGEYAVRSPRVTPLHRRARELAGRFRKVRFRWVPREQNAEADALTRRAYAERRLVNPRRLARAAELAPRVRPLGSGRFAVPSRSGRGEYEVDLLAGTCPCPDFARWGGAVKCKHVLATEMAARASAAFREGGGPR